MILAGAFCLWLLLSTVRGGNPHAIGEAFVVFRLPLFAAALQDWVLRKSSARLAITLSVIAAALWVGGRAGCSC